MVVPVGMVWWGALPTIVMLAVGIGIDAGVGIAVGVALAHRPREFCRPGRMILTGKEKENLCSTGSLGM